MESIREYLVSVTAAAMLCGIIKCLAGEKWSSSGILPLICGIFMTLTVIRPLREIQLKDLALLTHQIQSDAQLAVTEGEDYAKRAMARHIKEQSEAYILDKAQAFNAQITVEVTVDGDTQVPVNCVIVGKFSTYAKQQLTRILENDLGIRREDQQWISENS